MVRKHKLPKSVVEARVKGMQRIVASNLRYLMVSREVSSQEDLSRISGVGQSTISRYLGEKQVPAWGELVKLAHVLGTTVPTLISRDLGAEEVEEVDRAWVGEGAPARRSVKKGRMEGAQRFRIEGRVERCAS